ncbi:hypothetical protein [Microcoleus sp. OTE_8_concoct_300]|uniref:hypothetical protein n=1 Tax=Microcoleus sp. OTE_8_concoct_300 TaxID=2964710 RepID=UPI00403F8572
MSAPDQGGTVNIPHGLDVNKILAVVGRIELTSGQAAFAGSGLPNAGFFLWLASTHIVVTNLVANSFLIRSKPLTLLITHLP